MASFRIQALQHLRRDQRAPAQVPLDDVSGEQASSCYIGSLKYIDLIDKTTHEIHQDADKVTYTSLDEIADDLPDHAPRFILLSYPLTTSDGRLSVPYVLLYYLPITCNAETRMLYAGAKELIRNTAEVNKVIDIESTEDLEEVPTQLTT
ncbi:hypothetical protein THAR02_10481 [Trichoderma harzianum]|uniref:ADF-H domain-containing protein n=1 Tax=Trichoderma harzianum TaxID=5544 RepID=A0A0F9X9G7_TRIHA|nr:hypothetical protein THAR02_10481 [Trichoderma harzianum]